MVDSPFPKIYATNNFQNSFEDFEEMSSDVAVCDIDISFTNEIDLPAIPNEKLIIRILSVNQIKINYYLDFKK